MSRIFLSDQEFKRQLFPFSLTRHVADIRIGILTIREKWEHYLGTSIETTSDESISEDAVIYSANILPSREFIDSISSGNLPDFNTTRIIQYPWDIFRWNDWSLRNDYILITTGRQSQLIPKGVYTKNESFIFIEEGADVGSCWLNASAGPIYIGKNAVIMDGSMIQGPVSIGEGAIIKMGAKIYGATTIGPYCLAGGEIKNSVMMGYSNKAHDGYLGDSVLGEWCNLGAGSSNSNIKNTAGEVSVWHPALNGAKPVGLKCGLIMGDYSRASINTSFNTGTMVGICANVFGQGLTPKYIPSFSWGTDGSSKAGIEKTLDHISNWKKLKNKELSEKEIQQLRHIFEHNKF